MGWLVKATTRPFNPGKDPVSIVQETVWGPKEGLNGYGKSRPNQDSVPGPSSP